MKPTNGLSSTTGTRSKEKRLKVFTRLSDPWLKRAITVMRASIQSFVIVLSLE